MEPRPGRHVHIEVRVVHAVEPPQRRHGVEGHVLEVNGEVEQRDRQRHRDPPRQPGRVHQPPAVGFPGERDCDRRTGRHEPEHDHIHEKQAGVMRPAGASRECTVPARRKPFPQGEPGEHGEERPEPEERLELQGAGCEHGAGSFDCC